MKTKIFSLLLLILILIISGCETEETLPLYKLNGKDYVSPIKPGYFAEYKLTGDYNGTSFSGTLKQNCSQTNVKNPLYEDKNLISLNNYLTLVMGTDKAVSNTSYYYELTNDEVYIHGATNAENELYWVNEGNPIKLDFDYFVGASISISYKLDELVIYTWSDELYWFNRDNVTENITVTGIENAKCEIGEFECYKLLISSRSDNGNSEETAWTYPDIGYIKRERIFTGTSFTAEYNYELIETNVDFE